MMTRTCISQANFCSVQILAIVTDIMTGTFISQVNSFYSVQILAIVIAMMTRKVLFHVSYLKYDKTVIFQVNSLDV